MKMRYTRTSCLFACLFVCLFVCLFDFCHKSDLNYKLNILGPLCLWQCKKKRIKKSAMLHIFLMLFLQMLEILISLFYVFISCEIVQIIIKRFKKRFCNHIVEKTTEAQKPRQHGSIATWKIFARPEKILRVCYKMNNSVQTV